MKDMFIEKNKRDSMSPNNHTSTNKDNMDKNTSYKNEAIMVKEISNIDLTNLTDETVMQPISFDNNKLEKSNNDLTPK